MEILEINKIIAEFMGYRYCEWDEPQTQGYAYFDDENDRMLMGEYFTKSLDHLIPVWRRIGEHSVGVIKLDFHWNQAMFVEDAGYTKSKNLPEAAALATARKIQEINNTNHSVIKSKG
jgi:hypothetical protein